ncbi:MAG: helix-turn-helix domain-containing protein [Rectinemataceae bacterium]
MRVLLFAEAVVILFFTFVQLMARNKQPIHYCMIFTSLLLAYILMYWWGVDTGFLVRVPALIGSDVAATILLAPSFYLSSLSILYEGRRPVRRYAVYFVAPAVLALCSLLFNAITSPGKAFPETLGHFSSPAREFSALIAMFLLTAAVVIDLLAAHRLRSSGGVQHGSEFRGQVAFLICYLAAAMMAISSFIFRYDRLYMAACAIAGLIAVAYALSRMGVSYFSQDRPPPTRRARPEWDNSAEKLASRLQALMERTAPYRDEKLSLKALARMLGVEPLRLSYHLNVRHSLTFRSYINDWRLRSVCENLLKCPERSIIDIAFESGFNSKSSFNSLFFKKYGMTPRGYRRQNREIDPN